MKSWTASDAHRSPLVPGVVPVILRWVSEPAQGRVERSEAQQHPESQLSVISYGVPS